MDEQIKTTDYPVTLDITYPENPSRWYALGTLLFLIPKFIAVIPHIIIIYILNYIIIILILISQIAVLFTGRYPRAIFDFNVGFIRWQTRLNAFLIGLTDKYPPYSLK